MPNWHDALLISLKGDTSQWAYLVTGPKKWHNKKAYEKMAQYAFSYWKHGISMAKFKEEPEKFNKMINKLFLTKKEFANAERKIENRN